MTERSQLDKEEDSEAPQADLTPFKQATEEHMIFKMLECLHLNIDQDCHTAFRLKVQRVAPDSQSRDPYMAVPPVPSAGVHQSSLWCYRMCNHLDIDRLRCRNTAFCRWSDRGEMKYVFSGGTCGQLNSDAAADEEDEYQGGVGHECHTSFVKTNIFVSFALADEASYVTFPPPRQPLQPAAPRLLSSEGSAAFDGGCRLLSGTVGPDWTRDTELRRRRVKLPGLRSGGEADSAELHRDAILITSLRFDLSPLDQMADVFILEGGEINQEWLHIALRHEEDDTTHSYSPATETTPKEAVLVLAQQFPLVTRMYWVLNNTPALTWCRNTAKSRSETHYTQVQNKHQRSTSLFGIVINLSLGPKTDLLF
ncbi:hypothetical protein EYF80_041731 [Liparis tanakae]|uniref:Uncharacterized protein n=1 Tax=Liparis tanakae TaxID=230148 RepID=A0A4Z2G5L4_9TELE|nr:hypothetical protein EYF80_041731 [Liparis tanakae]